MNNRGYGMIGFVILLIFLVIMWALIFGKMFKMAGENAVASGAVGLEAFLWTNINLWFGIILIMVALVYFRFAGGSE